MPSFGSSAPTATTASTGIADTGEPVFTGGRDEAMSGLRHFQTLIVARDRLYVAGDGRVYSFAF